jgi:serine/threonine-protein kinase
MSSEFIGPYQIQGVIGRGGMATVYRAVDTQSGADVAVKLMARDFTRDASFRKRFQREEAVLRQLHHPNIVGVLDCNEHDGQPYLVMPYLSGGTLADRLERGPLSPPEIVAILTPIAAALDYAHSRGVIHRDVKPSNILFNGENQPLLADFGIVKVLSEVYTSVSTTGALVGTPEYMSPEQVEGSDALDGRCDIYALGVVLYEMLTRRTPFANTSPIVVAVKQLKEAPPPLRDVAPSLAGEWQPIINRALAKARDERFPTAAALVAAVTQVAGAPPKRVKLKPPVAFWLAFTALAMLVLGGGALWTLRDDRLTGGGDVAGLPTVATMAERPPRSTSTVAPTAMIVAIVDQEPSATPSGPPRVRLNDAAILRAGPGAIYDALAELASGDEATILGRDHVWAWYDVVLDDGRRGWLAGVSLRFLDPAAMTGIEPAGTIPVPPVTVTATTPPTVTPLPFVQPQVGPIPTAISPPTIIPVPPPTITSPSQQADPPSVDPPIDPPIDPPCPPPAYPPPAYPEPGC